MVARIVEVEGIGAVYARKLADAGLRTTDDLIKVAGGAAGRKKLADSTGIDEAKILQWVNRADLMRIKGIGGEYSDLLEAAGVDTVKELATRVPANLQAKLAEVNEAQKLVRRVPSESVVSGWVSEAKSVPSLVTTRPAGHLPSMRRIPPDSVNPGFDEEDKSRRLEAFRRAAGSWSDVDTDKLVEEIYQRRQRAERPPVNL